jgi:5-methylcytosine-specific restriction endonuclease McrA
MDKALETKIKSALRKVWRFSEDRRTALKSRSCAYCKKPRVGGEKFQADHLEPIVPISGWDSWDGYITRMMDGLVVACCKTCHAKKTRLENAARRKKKAASK